MNESIRERLKDIIDIPEKIKDLKDILKLDLTHFKGVSNKAAFTLNNVLKARKIEDFVGMEIDDSKFLTLKVLGVDPYDVNVWMFISRMISEGKIGEFLGPKKISIVGLDNAGKTAIFRIIQDKLKLDIFDQLPPTIGANQQIFDDRKGLKYVMVDMGGQESYRKEYIQNAERYFINIQFLMYVIDVQDPRKFEKSLDYLKEITHIIELLKENPRFLIIINKIDPEIKDDEQIKERFEFLSKEIKEIFQFKDFEYEVTPYSIYNSLGDSKTVIKGIRDLIITGSAGLKGKEFGSSLEQVLNLLINLTSSIESRFLTLEKANENTIEWIDYLKKTIQLISPETTLEIKSTEKFDQLKSKDALKESLHEELKSILKIKEQK
ncbi:MAG: 50S ribosome-binding GTPase [Candidatus Helarchaeota archaeon]|nr:50S ribosome-binding GTPase [Candidatus Helarchaeota archaeon]